ncbi:alpha/beta fold hydrolase [Streptomyces zingiberis]|uniref:Alpha/beta fold hydrolase n=1 Tax=Streptomyces zingiberis TaxID=2053010 RepID=A0ABX1C1W7_9ACTN|nr:alpha/beta fold hydrolase [Streptomyces zingiberis]NJQ02583.1 alpha/beta fold hydrolase [Streptomyces zingiberis]
MDVRNLRSFRPLRGPLRAVRTAPRRTRLAAAALAAALVAGAGTWTAVADDPAPVKREDRFLPMAAPGGDADGGGEEAGPRPARIDTSFYTSGPAGERRPAVLLAHGFGGSKKDLHQQAEELARDGYAVLTWSARGFGKSTGRIGLNDRENEVADVRRLVDWLADRPEVRLDAEGDPRVGIAGASYGGAVSLLTAGNDPRIDAVAAQNTYWDLSEALFPDGVFKKLWAGIFFTTGSTPFPTDMGPGAEEAPEGGAGQGGAGGEGGAGGTGQGGTGQDGAGQDGAGQDGAGQDGAQGGTGAGGAGADAPGGTADGTAAEGGLACGRFEKALCEMYERVATAGKPDAEAEKLLKERSPAAVGDRITAPTLVLGGQTDSLFPLSHADAMARQIKANGAPVSVDWLAGGHDGGDQETERVRQRMNSWFDRHLKGDEEAATGPAFRVTRTGGFDSADARVRLNGASTGRYPGLEGTDNRSVRLQGREQTVRNPAGGTPAAVSSVPGLAGAAAQLTSFGAGLALDFPGQAAAFDSAPLDSAVQVTGRPTAKVRVSSDAEDAVFFAKVYDVGPNGSQLLPSQLVAPIRVEGTDAEGGRTTEIRLPVIDHKFEAGHRMRLVLSATDMGYASPVEPADHRVALADDTLSVPTTPALAAGEGTLPTWVWALPLTGVALAAALLLLGRRRTATPAPDPARSAVPLEITGLGKRYAGSTDRYAVRDLSFRVERGQVLGLLGPNGAGKTTTLRMLMGLITPDAGEIRVFGHAIRPGAPVLSRVGAFVEGPGFLPHLSGRANLELYWQATGRPAEEAHLDEALEIAGLGDALERAVRTYSQGMRQRLAIAQAMLGLPDLLILDEPTNGLDPPQIREMRNVMVRYAEGGRTVIVSSHLLAEVEQTCTHLVVMDRGRLVTAGPVAEITGSGDTLLVGVSGDQVSAALADQVTALDGVGSAVPTEDGLLVRLDGMTSAQLLAELVRLGIPVDRVGPHRRLEDAFLTLIGGAP